MSFYLYDFHSTMRLGRGASVGSAAWTTRYLNQAAGWPEDTCIRVDSSI